MTVKQHKRWVSKPMHYEAYLESPNQKHAKGKATENLEFEWEVTYEAAMNGNTFAGSSSN